MTETRRVEHVLKGCEGIPVQAIADQLNARQPPIVVLQNSTAPDVDGRIVGCIIEAAPLENSFDLKVVLELTDTTPDAWDLLLRSSGTPESPVIIRAEMYPKE